MITSAIILFSIGLLICCVLTLAFEIYRGP
jgi:hypothetical protein